ncbi:hypothetical protein [Derxia gummosa]|uniref:Uncharacterized protein n=1 Tax=Derxia gummosa DSM 723 TaxID=1121388 RepID=A0A8B6X2D3_9BURK|nr:hypothetical protein [Derxia gummosa]
MTLTMEAVLRKTELGRAEISRRGESLSRHERNLLVVADGRRRAAELLDLVGMENQHSLVRLLEAGLLEIVSLASEAVHAVTPSRAEPEPGSPAAIAPELFKAYACPPDASRQFRLYAFLGAQIPEFFGLGAIPLTLRLERADSLDELVTLFDKLVVAVEKKRGPKAVALYRERLDELLATS